MLLTSHCLRRNLLHFIIFFDFDKPKFWICLPCTVYHIDVNLDFHSIRGKKGLCYSCIHFRCFNMIFL